MTRRPLRSLSPLFIQLFVFFFFFAILLRFNLDTAPPVHEGTPGTRLVAGLEQRALHPLFRLPRLANLPS
jgi:hypothetical protein